MIILFVSYIWVFMLDHVYQFQYIYTNPAQKPRYPQI